MEVKRRREEKREGQRAGRREGQRAGGMERQTVCRRRMR
jgi:hypothetical protein